MQNNQKTTTPQKETGITKAMPIILGAISLFIAVCLIFGNAGAFGAAISSFLRGLFASGAYAIPIVILLHAMCFKSDYADKRILSRAVLSFITILIVSSIDYTVSNIGRDLAFDPAEFYATASNGGFIGGTVSFCIASLIGCIGLIILDVAVVATTAIIFFGRKDSAARQGVLGVLGFVTEVLAKIEGKIKENRENRRAAKAENRRMETERRHSEFFNDNFFDTEGDMDEIQIRELGIHESRDKTSAERRPTLQSKVHNRSHVKSSNNTDNVKSNGFNFNVADSEIRKDTDSGHAFFGATDKNYASKHSSYGIDENADSVFTKDFDPFDFATGERLVAKASTKAQPVPRSTGVNEFISPVSALDEKSIADKKRREEFELRKRSVIASRAAEQRSAQATASTVPATAIPITVSAANAEVTMEFGASSADVYDSVPLSSSPAPENISLAAEEVKVPENADENIEQAYEQIADKVLKNNPAYAVSANKTTITTTVRSTETSGESIAPAEPEFTVTEASSAVIEEASTEIVDEAVVTPEVAVMPDTNASPEFRPYEPPMPDEAAHIAAAASATVLVTERNLVTPESSAANSVLAQELARYEEIGNESATSTESGEADAEISEASAEINLPVAEFTTVPSTSESIVFEEEPSPLTEASSAPAEVKETVFSFGDEDEQDIEEVADETADLKEIFGGVEEEEAIVDDAPIPPEEQNPDVIKQRAMFPILDEEYETTINKNETKTEAENVLTADSVQKTVEAPVVEERIQQEIQQDDFTFEQEVEAEVAADEEPPFEVEETTPIPAPTAVIPAEEKPKKKDYSNFVFPPIDLLHEVDEAGNENTAEEIKDNADKLIDTLGSFGVTASIKGVDRGPRITRYEVVPAKGVKVSNIMNLADDIALNLAADGIRMEAPIPGKSAVGVEIPNKKSSIVRLRELIETDDFKNLKSKTSVCMGKDVAGQPVFADVAKMPHALIAGATGMGKSVCINSLMLSILYKARPDEVKFIMIDPKQVEFTMYNGIPHLLVPVVTDVKQAAGTLMWAVEEMERRYGVLQEQCVRNIDAYNEKIALHPELGEQMSRIIIVIDEFAELIMQAKNPVESLIIRIAQKARAAGIHLIIGTQKPVKEVITGLIKSNIPSKLSCKVASNRDSILIFDAAGAEKLLDRGDMLIAFANSLKPQRVQCAFVADEEVEAVMDYLKQFSDGSNYDESVMEEIRRAADKCTKKGGGDRDDDTDDDGGSYGEGYLNNKEFLDAVEIAVNTRKISTSLIQRKLSIGYGKAAKFIDIMEDMGIVGEANGSKPREVMLSADEWHEKLARTTYD